MSDIRDARGYVGDYHDIEVHVYPRREYEKLKRIDNGIIYVLTEKGKYESLMVLKGKVIGHIDPHGGVTEYDNPFDFLASEKPKASQSKVEKEVAKQEEKKKELPPVKKGDFGPNDASEYLDWVNNKWDPIAEAMNMVDLTVSVIDEVAVVQL